METKPGALTNDETITRDELKNLLLQIKEFRTDVHIRFRTSGKTWHRNFCRVFVVSDTGVVLIDPIDNKVEIIPNLADIAQFEIDSRFKYLSGYTPYQIA